MSAPIKLSIITVNLNNAAGLSKTLESVASQTFTNYEHIIIDGGSTDGSVDIIKDYERKYNGVPGHLYWVSEPDKGIYNAMNKGIKVASGKYLYFLNSGDYLFKHTTLSLVFKETITDHEIIYGDFCLEKNNIRTLKGQPNRLTLSTFFYTTITQQATFINNSLFLEFGLYSEEYKIVSDWKFFLDVFLFKTVDHLHIALPIAVFTEGGISNNPDFYELHLSERKTVFEKINLPQPVKIELFRLTKLEEFKRDIEHSRLIPAALYIENKLRSIKMKLHL